MRILGIETSCDDTGIAIYDDDLKLLLSNKLYKQKLHGNYGGIVPEIASRSHLKIIMNLIRVALIEARLCKDDINGIAYTAGPGLIGSLMIGASIGRALSYSLGIPSIPIHHLEGHLLTPMLKRKINFPFLGLLISGGHTQIIEARKIGNYKILGKSLDDSIGEVFDKVARFLGLSYPGGPKLEKLAKYGRKNRYKFPRPMINRKNLMFSFSGLKTFIKNLIFEEPNNFQTKADIALEFENSIIEIISKKCLYALSETQLNCLVVSGGVSAHKTLRKNLCNLMKEKNKRIFFSPCNLCTDNGAMIAFVGAKRLRKLNFSYKNENCKRNIEILVKPNWSIEELKPVYF